MAVEVCKLAQAHAAPAAADRIVEVGLELGDDAGFDLANLEFCLESLLACAPFGRARPVIQRVRGDVFRLSYLEVDDGSAADRSP